MIPLPLMTRAKGLLARGDFAAARLLLERAANAPDATAAFLLAQTYDPAVLKVRDTRSITPDPVMARGRSFRANKIRHPSQIANVSARV
jgi:hypothetical protein